MYVSERGQRPSASDRTDWFAAEMDSARHVGGTEKRTERV